DGMNRAVLALMPRRRGLSIPPTVASALVVAALSCASRTTPITEPKSPGGLGELATGSGGSNGGGKDAPTSGMGVKASGADFVRSESEKVAKLFLGDRTGGAWPLA